MQEKKKLIYAIFIAIIVVCGMLYVILIRTDKNVDAEVIPAAVLPTNEANSATEIFVQICGAIKQEGVYQVPKGTRIYQIIELAGGLTKDAATEVVNQAREAQDGEMIVFPTIQAVENGTYVVDGENTLVHINAATIEQLMTLPGVGEAKAKSIIAFREINKGFKTIEEIMKVDGIKQSMFNKIKELITL